MKLTEALEILGVKEGTSLDETSKVYEEKKTELEGRLAGAPTEGLRVKYAGALEELKLAFDTIQGKRELSFPSSELTKSAIVDLPGAMPFFTQGGTGGAGTAAVAIKEGDVLLDRYEIRRAIGQGGMGAVYAAYDRNADQEIAIKVLLPAYLKDERARERFLSEAKISRSLSHQCIVNVYDINKSGDLYFISMELLEGRTLRSEILAHKAEGKSFAMEQINDWTKQLCDCLSYAHQFTIHRDIKPENIFITTEGSIRLMDFGLARLKSTSQLTRTGMAVGTAYYMAPEQLEGAREIDARADQYGVAVTLYELVTGSVPVGRVKSAHLRRADCPREFSDALDKALESDPKDRFASIEEFKRALLAEKKTQTVISGSVKSPESKKEKKQTKKLIPPWAIGSIATTILLGGAFIWFSGGDKAGGGDDKDDVVKATPIAQPTETKKPQATQPKAAPTEPVPVVIAPTKAVASPTRTAVPPTYTPEPTETPTATPTLLPPTKTATPLPTDVPTLVPTAVRTVAPSATSFFEIEATPVVPTPRALNTAAAATPIVRRAEPTVVRELPARAPDTRTELAESARQRAADAANAWESFAARNNRTKSAVAEQARAAKSAGDVAFASGDMDSARRNYDKAQALFSAAMLEKPRSGQDPMAPRPTAFIRREAPPPPTKVPRRPVQQNEVRRPPDAPPPPPPPPRGGNRFGPID